MEIIAKIFICILLIFYIAYLIIAIWNLIKITKET